MKTRKKYDWTGTAIDYLDMVKQDPGLAELAHSRIYKMLRDAGIEAIIPIVQATNQVLAAYKSVRHQRAAMQTSPIKHGHLFIEPDDNQIDLSNKRIRGITVF